MTWLCKNVWPGWSDMHYQSCSSEISESAPDHGHHGRILGPGAKACFCLTHESTKLFTSVANFSKYNRPVARPAAGGVGDCKNI